MGKRDELILRSLASSDWWETKIAPRLSAEAEGCLRWQGAHSAGGYGELAVPRSPVVTSVHRVAYLHQVGTPVVGVIDHTCNQRDCANPEHLREVSQRENVLAGHSRTTARINAEKTHCIRGHPLTGPEAQLRQDRLPSRVCVLCNRINARKAA
jgi:hypothetical protein